MPKGIYIRTEKHLSILSKYRGSFKKGHKINLGRVLLKEHKDKIGLAGIGRIVTQETRDKISKSHMGLKPTEETRQKLIKSHLGQKAWNKGIPATKEAMARLMNSEYQINRKLNAKYPVENAKVYSSGEWVKIRNQIYRRDKYICQECGKLCTTKRGLDMICCHHIDYNVKNLDLNNLITL